MNVRFAIAFSSAVILLAGVSGAADAERFGDGRNFDEPRGGWNSWYGAPRGYRQDSGTWAVGTFYGVNGANGQRETVTIRPDGSAELRVPGAPPEYGSFAGETLTIGSRMSKVEPARGGIVIDGSYYRR
jgi:hypothetical protein